MSKDRFPKNSDFRHLTSWQIVRSNMGSIRVGQMADIVIEGHGKFGPFNRKRSFRFNFQLSDQDIRVLRSEPKDGGTEIYDSLEHAAAAIADERNGIPKPQPYDYIIDKFTRQLETDFKVDHKNAAEKNEIVHRYAARLARLYDQQNWYLRLLGVDESRKDFDLYKRKHFDPALREGEIKKLVEIIDALRLRKNVDILRFENVTLTPTDDDQAQIEQILGLTHSQARQLALDFADNCDLKGDITDLQASLDQILRIRSMPDPLSEVGFRKNSTIKKDRNAPVWPPRKKFKLLKPKTWEILKPNRWANQAKIIADYQQALFNGTADQSIDAFLEHHKGWLEKTGFTGEKLEDLRACLNASAKSIKERNTERVSALKARLGHTDYHHLTPERRDDIIELRGNLPRISKGRREQWIDYSEIERKLFGTTKSPRDALLHVRSPRLERLVDRLLSHKPQTLQGFDRTKNNVRKDMGLPHWPTRTGKAQPAPQQTEQPAQADAQGQAVGQRQQREYQHRVDNSKPALQKFISGLRGVGKAYLTIVDSLIRYTNSGRLSIGDIPFIFRLSLTPLEWRTPFIGSRRADDGQDEQRFNMTWIKYPVYLQDTFYAAGMGVSLVAAYTYAWEQRQKDTQPYDVPFAQVQLRACGLLPDQRSPGIDIAPAILRDWTNARIFMPDPQTVNGNDDFLAYRACLWLRGHLSEHFMAAGINDAAEADAMATQYLSRFVVTRDDPNMVGPTTFENTRDLIGLANILGEPDRLMPAETVTAGWDAARVATARGNLQEMAWAHFYLPDAYRQTNLRPDIVDNIAFDSLSAEQKARITAALDLEFSAALSWKEAKFGTDHPTDRLTAEGAFQFIDDTGLMALSLAAQEGGLIDQILTNPLLRDEHQADLIRARDFARSDISITRTQNATFYRSTNMDGYTALVRDPFIAYIMHRAHLQHEREQHPSLRTVAPLSAALDAYNDVHVFGRIDPGTLTPAQQSRAANANCGEGVGFIACQGILEGNASRDFQQVGRWPIAERITYERKRGETWRDFPLETAF